ncbi:MAG: hypothetical protein AB9915_03560 [Candidatus Dojkabacteria bacterium]
MNCSSNKDKSVYSGQALVMAMVVVVVTVIIGLSVFSRVLQDQRLVVFEQASGEALEIADSYVNLFSSINTDVLFTDVENGEININGYDNIKSLLSQYGIENLDSEVFAQCKSGASDINAKLSLTSEEYLELGEAITMGYVLNSAPASDSCNMQLFFEPRGYSSVGLIVHKIYGKSTSTGKEYKEYGLDDILPYCISSTTECTSSRLQDKDSWSVINTIQPLTIGLKDSKDGYTLDEVRITPIAGTVAVKSHISEPGCAGNLDLKTLKISVTVTCANATRGKEVLIPRSNNLSYSSIFDYTVYNGNGLLQPY